MPASGLSRNPLPAWTPLLSLALAPFTVAHSLGPRDDMHTMHHGQPLTEINETEILMWHLPTPPSYWSIDIENPDPTVVRYPGLIALHVTFMILAFFVALPAGIALRSVKHHWHAFTIVVFYTLCGLGCATSALYRKLTPDMYQGSTHSSQGYLIILSSLVLSVVDIAAFFARLYAFPRSKRKLDVKSFWLEIVLGREADHGAPSDYAEMNAEDPEEYDEIKALHIVPQQGLRTDRPDINIETQDLVNQYPAGWSNETTTYSHRRSTYSATSDRTVFAAASPRDLRHSDETLRDVLPPLTHSPPKPFLQRVIAVAYATWERFLVFAAFGEMLTGIVVYTGGCRNNYINGCLAHLIKGGIFWCYGLFTFARFLGSHSEMGWAWNISPIGNTVSAEFIESAVIFLYGISNTWMERFGAHSGDPYTTKQVQHISIAVMFWFAGLVGMAMESRRFRNWLAASALGPVHSRNVSEPSSYRGSFNPFPALVIGVTGAAMSAHAQTYLFQVQIHQLWGWLLLGFSVLRCFTYFFLWLGPPSSVLPSRPPTEALGSFFLACGGLMFMLSTEEVTLAAMRRGRDDMMMFLNVAVAITCFAFCWTLCVVAFNGWLKYRHNHQVLSPSS